MSRPFTPYDQRGYPTVDVREGYRRWSALYDDKMSGDIDLDLLATLECVDFAVERVVDLACGTGRVGRWLRERGARRVDGVDVCPEMLERARATGAYASLACEDVRRTSLPAARADLVTNVLSIEHLPELDPFHAECARLLRPGGALIVIGYHPHFLLNGIPTHFEDVDGKDLAIENHIHLFSDHVRAAHATGFSLRELAEAVVDERWLERLGSWKRHLGKPASFAFVWQKHG